MALVVEDGSGMSDADAFVSVEDCDAYCEDNGLTGWTAAARSPSDDDEAAIRRATRWLSTAFSWKGARTRGRAQALAHPRIGMEDGEGNDIASDDVAEEVVQACCVAAAAERASPGILSPMIDLTARVRSEQIGSIRVEYASAPINADAGRPVLLLVRDLIGGLLSTTANSLVGSAVRR